MTVKLVIALILILSIDVFFFLGQEAMNDINPDGTQFYNYEGSVISQYDSGNQTIPTTATLPTGSASVSPTTGNVFTDIFTSIKETVLNIPVIGTALKIVTATPTYISSTGLPTSAKFALNGLYYAILSFLVVSFIWGRE